MFMFMLIITKIVYSNCDSYSFYNQSPFRTIAKMVALKCQFKFTDLNNRKYLPLEWKPVNYILFMKYDFQKI